LFAIDELLFAPFLAEDDEVGELLLLLLFFGVAGVAFFE